MQGVNDNPINEATRKFVADHANDDVRRLALRGSTNPDVNLPLALDQIAGRQYARRKLPAWADTDGIIYPPHLSMEQCSSEATARYKASLVRGNTLVDLTGGLGVDCSFMSLSFTSAVYVEKLTALCNIAKHNFHLLNNDKINVVNDDAEKYLNQMKPVDVIYVDPARRDTDGRRTYGIADCTPDVATLAPQLLDKARQVMIKLSPMLDITQVLATLPNVTDVHIVSTSGECKELLVIMSRQAGSEACIHCVNDGKAFSYSLHDTPVDATLWDEKQDTAKPLYLYEPNASIMKAGCFNHIAIRYGLTQVSNDSHLFVSDKYIDDFPGRTFAVDTITSMNKSELKQALSGINRANVAVRNFPLRAAELAKRLRLADGGDSYLFGTTTASGKHIILVCHKTKTGTA